MKKVYIAVGSGEDAAAWGSGATPDEARADAVANINKLAAWDGGEDAWDGEDPQTWAAALQVVIVEGPAPSVDILLRELLA